MFEVHQKIMTITGRLLKDKLMTVMHYQYKAKVEMVTKIKSGTECTTATSTGVCIIAGGYRFNSQSAGNSSIFTRGQNFGALICWNSCTLLFEQKSVFVV